MTALLATTVFLDTVKPITEIIATALATVGILWGFFLYRSQTLEKRAERFSQTRARLRTESPYREIKNLIETGDEALHEVAFSDKLDYICFFEEIALLVNTGLLKRSVVHYMLGYYIVKCWNCEPFWKGIDKFDKWWSLFGAFAQQMESLGNGTDVSLRYDAASLRL